MFSKRWVVGCQRVLRDSLFIGGRNSRRRSSSLRPRLEVLEDRAVPAILWNEAVNGDLSNSQATPTPLTAGLGTNSVLGTVGRAPEVSIGSLCTFPGHAPRLARPRRLRIQRWPGISRRARGTSFVGNPWAAGSYLGYAHFGTSATNGTLPPTNLVGANLLPIMGNTSIAFGAQGFQPPLASGDYTFLIQQLGSNTTYQFDYVTVEAPTSDMVVDKAHTGNFRQGDQSDTYSITATNSGTAPTTGTVTITDILPAGLTPTADNNGIINGWNVSTNGQTVTATRNDVLAAGNNYPDLTLTVAVADDAPANVVNTATVSGGGETNTANNSDDDPTTIEPGHPISRR